jgi:hypothetical protein
MNRSRIVFAFLFAALSGCGSRGVGTLSGNITHEGKPLNAGTIQVIHSNGMSFTAEIQPDGTYRLPDLPEGAVLVGVSNPHPLARYQELTGFAKTEEQRAAIRKPTPEELRAWIGIPAGYANPDTSGLTAEIKKGLNSKDFALVGSPEPAPPANLGYPALPPRAKGK